MKPRFEHGCAICTFLGHHEGYDLYHHKGRIEETVIARYGRDGDYLSGLGMRSEPLIEAHRRALNARLTEELPYEFDLQWDVKTLTDVRQIAAGNPHRSSARPADLLRLFDQMGIAPPPELEQHR